MFEAGELHAEFAACASLAELIAKLEIPGIAATGAKHLAAAAGDSLEGVVALSQDWLSLKATKGLSEKAREGLRGFFAESANAEKARAIEAQLREFGMHWQSEKKVAAGLPLLARITRLSKDQLGLVEGMDVVAQIKSVALLG